MAIFKKIKPSELQAPAPRHLILLVDDEPDNLNVMRSILEQEYRILQAADGQAALDVVKNLSNPEELTLVVTDQRMPNLTGVQLCEQLRTLTPNAIRIIITGYIDIDAIVEAVNRAHIYKFILKPYERQHVKDTIQLAVQAWETRQARQRDMSNLQSRLNASNAQLAACQLELAQLREQLKQLQNPAAAQEGG